MRSSASHSAGPHGRLPPPLNGKSGTYCWGREGSTQCAQQSERVRGYDGDNMLVWAGGGVVAVNAGCQYMGGTRGSGVVSSADDVLEMSGVRGVGGVCEMCMCLAQGGVGCVGVSA